MQPDQSIRRRTAIKTIAAGAFLAMAGSTTVNPIGSAAADADLTAEDHEVENDDGELTTLTIEPSLEVTWTDFTDPPETLTLAIESIRVDIDQTGSWDETVSPSETEIFSPLPEETDFKATYAFDDPFDILADTTLSASSFEPDATDERVTDIEVTLAVTVENDDETAHDEVSATFALTVTDTGASVESSDASIDLEGELNTDAD